MLFTPQATMLQKVDAYLCPLGQFRVSACPVRSWFFGRSDSTATQHKFAEPKAYSTHTTTNLYHQPKVQGHSRMPGRTPVSEEAGRG